ncbi:MAG: hypothetical protein Q3971_00330 [Moraxella sp.]|nr:hypothetical protein [Moraxella sp.]
MKAVQSLSVAIIAMMSMATVAYAEPKPVTDKNELVGCYERINFSPTFAKQMNPQEYWVQPYQWFCFDQDGTFSSAMSTQYDQKTTQSLQRTFKVLPKTFRYEFIQKGIVKTADDKGLETLYWQTTFLDKDITAPDGTLVSKGVLIMGLIHPETGEMMYWRYLKKLK